MASTFLGLCILVLTVAALAGLSRWMGRSVETGKQSARAAAQRRGVTIEDVERDVPVFLRGNRFSRLTPSTCTCYSLARHDGHGSGSWEFLQRDKAAGAQYLNGWLYRSPDGPPSGPLHAVLLQIASDWREELLEFAGDSTSVRAYWEEHGGVETAHQIINWLQALDQASAAV